MKFLEYSLYSYVRGSEMSQTQREWNTTITVILWSRSRLPEKSKFKKKTVQVIAARW